MSVPMCLRSHERIFLFDFFFGPESIFCRITIILQIQMLSGNFFFVHFKHFNLFDLAHGLSFLLPIQIVVHLNINKVIQNSNEKEFFFSASNE